MNLKLSNNKVIYYTGFGWGESKQIQNNQEWSNYLNNFSNKLQSPLEITIN